MIQVTPAAVEDAETRWLRRAISEDRLSTHISLEKHMYTDTHTHTKSGSHG